MTSSRIAALQRVGQRHADSIGKDPNEPPPMNEADFMRRFGGADVRMTDIGG